MPAFILNFLADEDGAVTVDMTMLMAMVVGLSLAAMAAVNAGVEDLSGDISDQAVSMQVGAAW